MNIIMHGQRTLLGIKQDRFVSSLKQRSVPSVTPVEPDPIAGVKPMHRSREARPRPHFHLQMIVVGHQYMGVDLHAKTLRKLPQSLQKIFVTTPNPKNHLSLMPTVHHMIPAVRYFQSGMPGHTPPSNQLAVMSNVKIRPLMPSSDRLMAANLTVPEIIRYAPTAEFDPIWGRGYVTGDYFIRMVLAGLNNANLEGVVNFEDTDRS
jgi:hypothetical protein